MKKCEILMLIFWTALITSCVKQNEINLQTSIESEQVNTILIEDTSFPPCLSYPEGEYVIRNIADYELLKENHAFQGDYEYFIGDGLNKEFKLSYQILDSNNDLKIGPNDLSIYYNGEITLEYENQLFTISSYPFRVDEEENIIVFDTEYPYTKIGKIPHNLIYTVNPEDGTVTFQLPPVENTEIKVSANKRLYEEYQGIACSLDEFDFADRLLIGKRIGGNGCLQGFDFEVYVDQANKTIVYDYTINEVEEEACPEIYLSYTKWIIVENIDKTFEVKFD